MVESLFSSEAELASSRAASDKELIRGGADWLFDDSGRRLEITPEQILSAVNREPIKPEELSQFEFFRQWNGLKFILGNTQLGL